MDQAIKDNINVMIPYLTILNQADDCVKEAQNIPDTLIGDDRIAFLTSCRNSSLAHASGTPEAAFIGNLSEEPTTTQAELEARGIKTPEAIDLIQSRDAIRAAALGLVD